MLRAVYRSWNGRSRDDQFLARLQAAREWDDLELLLRTLTELDARPLLVSTPLSGPFYNFKGVTRFDRCTTCHKGIARPTYTKENLADLIYEADSPTKALLQEAHEIRQQPVQRVRVG